MLLAIVFLIITAVRLVLLRGPTCKIQDPSVAALLREYSKSGKGSMSGLTCRRPSTRDSVELSNCMRREF